MNPKPTTHDLADDLMALANKLKSLPAAKMALDEPTLYLGHFWKNKDSFLALCRALPKPLVKRYEDDELVVAHMDGCIEVNAAIQRSAICRLVTPAQEAVYECLPLLTDDEEQEIGK